MAVYTKNFINPAGHTLRADSDDFGPPQLGGVVNVRWGSIAYTQNGVTAYIATLPEGAEIVGWLLDIGTGFNDSGTDLLDVGDGTTANRFANDISLASAGQVVTGFDSDEMFTPLTAETQIFGTYTGQNSNASQGAAKLAVFFILR